MNQSIIKYFNPYSPVYLDCENMKFYWTDDAGASHGPYDSMKMAKNAVDEYLKQNDSSHPF